MSASERDWMSRRDEGMAKAPWSVTKWLIVLNVAVFALGFFWTVKYPGYRFSVSGPEYYGAYSVSAVWEQGQYWRLITYQFVHANVGHLVFNMVALSIFGNLVERVMGRSRYLLFYLLCGIAGALFSSLLASFGLFDRDGMLFAWNDVPMVGASGAIYGMLTASAVMFPRERVMLLFPPVELSLRTLALCLLGFGVVVILFGWENAGGEAGHLGGMIMGFLLLLIPFFRPWRPERTFVWGKAPSERRARARDREELDARLEEHRRKWEVISRKDRE